MSILFMLSLTSCAPKSYLQDSMYKHAKSMYAYKKYPSEENLDKHLKTLEGIIAKSQSNGKRVPPGICSEYGFFLLQTNPVKAKKYLLLEKELYPESTVFINNLLEKEERSESLVR